MNHHHFIGNSVVTPAIVEQLRMFIKQNNFEAINIVENIAATTTDITVFEYLFTTLQITPGPSPEPNRFVAGAIQYMLKGIIANRRGNQYHHLQVPPYRVTPHPSPATPPGKSHHNSPQWEPSPSQTHFHQFDEEKVREARQDSELAELKNQMSNMSALLQRVLQDMVVITSKLQTPPQWETAQPPTAAEN